MPESILSPFRREYAGAIEEYRQVVDINARDAIPSSRRWQGMHVYVISTQTTYELIGGILNSNWRAIGGAGIKNVTQAGEVITITKEDDSTIVIDLSTKRLVIDGYNVRKGTGNISTEVIEEGDYCDGWEGDTFVAFRVDGIPYLTNRSLAINNSI